MRQHLEHDEHALAAQRAEYEEAQAAAREAASSAQAAVARELQRQKDFLEQVKLSKVNTLTLSYLNNVKCSQTIFTAVYKEAVRCDCHCI